MAITEVREYERTGNVGYETAKAGTNSRADSESFAAILEKYKTTEVTDDGKKKNMDSVGVIYRQMVTRGEENSSIVHNGVNMSFECTKTGDNTYKFQTTVGAETGNTKWYTVMTKDGAVTFDINNPGDILKCLDMFSPEDARKILEVIQAQRIANSMDGEVEKLIDKVTAELSGERDTSSLDGDMK